MENYFCILILMILIIIKMIRNASDCFGLISFIKRSFSPPKRQNSSDALPLAETSVLDSKTTKFSRFQQSIKLVGKDAHRANLLYMSRLARQSHQREDHLSFVRRLLRLVRKEFVGEDLTFEEKELFNQAFKTLLSQKRTQWRSIYTIYDKVER